MDIDSAAIVLSKLDVLSYINAIQSCKLFYQASKLVLPMFTDDVVAIPPKRYINQSFIKVPNNNTVYPNMHIIDKVDNIDNCIDCLRLTFKCNDITLPKFTNMLYLQVCFDYFIDNIVNVSNIRHVELECKTCYDGCNTNMFSNVEVLTLNSIYLRGKFNKLNKIKELYLSCSFIEDNSINIVLDKLSIINCSFTLADNIEEYLNLYISNVTLDLYIGDNDFDVISNKLCTKKIQTIDIYNPDLLNIKRVDEISITRSDIIDVTCLKDCIKVKLLECQCLSKVSALQNVHEIYIKSNSLIKDVSMLGNVYKLSLIECYGIKDFSALSNVKYLDISNTNATDVSMLNNVYSLNISHCRIKRFNKVHNNHILDISYCDVYDMRKFVNVKYLNIRGNKVVRSIKCLVNVISINLGDNPELTEYI
jgi:hypothetical protein